LPARHPKKAVKHSICARAEKACKRDSGSLQNAACRSPGVALARHFAALKKESNPPPPPQKNGRTFYHLNYAVVTQNPHEVKVIQNRNIFILQMKRWFIFVPLRLTNFFDASQKNF
jgi:hypothetical protein